MALHVSLKQADAAILDQFYTELTRPACKLHPIRCSHSTNLKIADAPMALDTFVAVQDYRRC